MTLLHTSSPEPLMVPVGDPTGLPGWQRFEGEGVVPSSLGHWLMRHRLYARGTDFSQYGEHSQMKGSSFLKRLWQGKPTAGVDAWQAWVFVEEEKPRAVVMWVSGQVTDIEVQEPIYALNRKPKQSIPGRRLGQVMAFTHPKWRQRGLIRGLLREAVVPELVRQGKAAHQEGRMPCVAAVGHLVGVLREAGVAVVGAAHDCLGFRSDMWRAVREARMWPELKPEVDYLVEPVAIPAPPRRRMRA